MLTYKKVNIVFAILLALAILYGWVSTLPWWIYLTVVILYLLILIYGTVTVSAQFFTPIRCNGRPESKSVAITFDDGPVSGNTDKIIYILRNFQVKAAFFCIGNRIDKNPEMVKQLHEEGHLIANHSYFHATGFDWQSSAKMRHELASTDAAVRRAVGLKPRFFRPPYGVTNPNLAKAIRMGKYVTVGWSVRSFDTVIRNKDKLLRRVTSRLKGGDIISFHDHCEVTMEILPDLIRHIREIGLKIVRVDELLEEKPYG